MTEDYLWDRTGPADPEVARLELTLAALRLREAEHAPVPRAAWAHASSLPSSRARRSTTMRSALLCAAATAALIWAWVSITTPADDGALEQAAADIVRTDPVAVGQPAPAFGPPRAPADQAPLPHVPNAAQIKDGLAVHLPEAKACGSRHGGLSGERVVIKLSVAGATGTVTSSIALGQHADTSLGECVATALMKATFPVFSKESIGIRYPVSMD